MSRIKEAMLGIKSAIFFGRVSRLRHSNRDQEALDILAKFDGLPWDIAKAVLISADILTLMRKYPEALRNYTNFLNNHVESIESSRSRIYLKVYASFFQENALRGMGQDVPISVTKAHLRAEAQKAGYLERTEFPPP